MTDFTPPQGQPQPQPQPKPTQEQDSEEEDSLPPPVRGFYSSAMHQLRLARFA